MLPGALPVGTIIDGRYEVLEVVGEGGMGQVFKAREFSLGRTVALKVLHGSLAFDEHARRRFEREGHAIARLSHEHIVTFYRLGVWEEFFYIAMEFLEGRSLRDLIDAEGKLEWRRVLSIATSVCKALQHAHGNDVVHRDLKPSNILLLEEPHPDFVKIVDFGLASFLTLEQRLTQTGDLLGTAHYMSPEQCRGQRVDGRSDIYSLACVLHEAITGEPPFAGETAMGLIHKHVAEAPRKLSDLASKAGLPPALPSVLYRGLEKDPRHRYQTMDEFRHDLELVMQGRDSEVSARATKGTHTIPIVLLVVALVSSALIVYRFACETINLPKQGQSVAAKTGVGWRRTLAQAADEHRLGDAGADAVSHLRKASLLYESGIRQMETGRSGNASLSARYHAHLDAGSCYIGYGEFDRAAYHWEKAMNMYPSGTGHRFEAGVNRCIALLRAGKTDESQELLNRLTAEYETHGRTSSQALTAAFLNTGNVLMALKPELAEHSFRKAVDHGRKHLTSQGYQTHAFAASASRLSQLWRQSGRARDADELLAELRHHLNAKRFHSGDPHIAFSYAMEHSKKNRREEALIMAEITRQMIKSQLGLERLSPSAHPAGPAQRGLAARPLRRLLAEVQQLINTLESGATR